MRGTRADDRLPGRPPSRGAAAAARRYRAPRGHRGRRRPAGAQPRPGRNHLARGRGRRASMTIRRGGAGTAATQCVVAPSSGESPMRPVSARSPLAIALALVLPLGLAACDRGATDAPTTTTAGAGASAAATADEREAETARLNAWFEEQFEEQLQFSPIRMTFLGRKDLYDRIDDVSEAGIQKRLEWMQASVAAMESQFDYDRLDPEAQLSWNLWKKQYESARDGMPFLLDGYAFDQMSGMHSMAPTFLIN